MMLRKLIFYPFLFSLYPALFLYSQNQNKLPIYVICGPLTLSLVICLISFIFCLILYKNAQKAGLMAFIIIILFFSYGHIFSLIQGMSFGNFLAKQRYLYPLWAFLFFLALFLIKRTRSIIKFSQLSYYLNMFSMLLIITVFINIAYNGIGKTFPVVVNNYSESHQSNLLVKQKEGYPDIYFIILDAYTSDYALERYYHYKNDDFKELLEKKGFQVFPHSYSNYCFTYLVVPSILNMDYHQKLLSNLDRESNDYKILDHLRENNRVMNFLNKHGYKIIKISSDEVITGDRGGEFFQLFIGYTVLMHFRMDRFLTYAHREKILKAFSLIEEIHELQGSKFVYAHIMCPHPPFVFGPKGEEVQILDKALAGFGFFKTGGWIRGLAKFREYYVDQVKFTNIKVTKLVEEILKKSKRAPIIVIMGDHGAASFHDTSLESDVPPKKKIPSQQFIDDQMSVFIAIYLPEEYREKMNSEISPVNIYRMIFNKVFETKLSMLAEKSYYSSMKYPYNFIDVTDKLFKGK